ncbi:hypothetical protein F5878DRAFT_529058, partial [Lentinula raphanica]
SSKITSDPKRFMVITFALVLLDSGGTQVDQEQLFVCFDCRYKVKEKTRHPRLRYKTNITGHITSCGPVAKSRSRNPGVFMHVVSRHQRLEG